MKWCVERPLRFLKSIDESSVRTYNLAMTHGPTKYPPKKCCIYCGRGDIQLTDEHIVPFALGGSHLLQKASCLVCADITKKFEQDVARGLWGDARASYGAPTRRKKERKSQQVLRDPASTSADLVVPMD